MRQEATQYDCMYQYQHELRQLHSMVEMLCRVDYLLPRLH